MYSFVYWEKNARRKCIRRLSLVVGLQDFLSINTFQHFKFFMVSIVTPMLLEKLLRIFFVFTIEAKIYVEIYILPSMIFYKTCYLIVFFFYLKNVS